MTVAIVILNYNGLEDTLNCLTSVYNLSYPDFKVIVVDNGSLIKSKRQILKKFPRTIVFENKKNLGFAGGCNIGIRYALKKKYPYILLLNNDAIVDRHLLDFFVRAAQEKPRAGIFGAKILNYKAKAQIDNVGSVFSWEIGKFVDCGKKNHKRRLQNPRKVDYVCGCCLFLKSEVVKKIGLLEKKFFLLWEETDFCYRAKKNNFEIWTVPRALVWHKVSASFSGGKIHSEYFWWRGRLLWVSRNLNSKEKFLFYGKFLSKDIFKLIKLYCLKKFVLFILNVFTNQKVENRKIFQVLRYQAAIQGILDYFLKNFGAGPRWIKNSRFKQTVFKS